MFPSYSHISERMSKIFCLTFKPFFFLPISIIISTICTHTHTLFFITFAYPSFNLHTGSKWLRVQALEIDLLISNTQVTLLVKNPSATGEDIRDAGLIPGLGRSPGGVHGNPCQYSFLENPMDRGAWWAMIHRVTKSQTQQRQLSMPTLNFLVKQCFHVQNKVIIIKSTLLIMRMKWLNI